MKRKAQGLEDEVLELRNEVRALGEQLEAKANPPLSEAAMRRLHNAYRATGDPDLAKVLDELCDDPECEDGTDEDETGDGGP
jgi:hypothetical protein